MSKKKKQTKQETEPVAFSEEPQALPENTETKAVVIAEIPQDVTQMKLRDGRIHLRVLFGHEANFGALLRTASGRCDECGTEQRKYHRVGCSQEECPSCGRRLTMCNCLLGEGS